MRRTGNFTRTTVVLLLIFLCLKGSLNAAPILLHVDNTHSSIQFSVPFVGVTEVNGSFERFCGTFYYDDSNVSKSHVELFIDASSINTGLRIRDKDLRNDYLEVGKFPLIYFKSTSISSSGDKNFHVTGDLNLHGRSRSISFKMSLLGDIVNADGGRELGLKVEPVILHRLDFGVMEGTVGGGTVGDSITVKSTLRVRDLAPYRKEFDARYPDAVRQKRIMQTGKYTSSTGKILLIMNYGERNLMAFIDEWMWLSELKNSGPNTYKSTSFNNSIEIKNPQIIFVSEDGPETFVKTD